MYESYFMLFIRWARPMGLNEILNSAEFSNDEMVLAKSSLPCISKFTINLLEKTLLRLPLYTSTFIFILFCSDLTAIFVFNYKKFCRIFTHIFNQRSVETSIQLVTVISKQIRTYQSISTVNIALSIMDLIIKCGWVK